MYNIKMYIKMYKKKREFSLLETKSKRLRHCRRSITSVIWFQSPQEHYGYAVFPLRFMSSNLRDFR